MTEHAYVVIAFSKENDRNRGCLVGVYTDKPTAILELIRSGPHDVWEFFYNVICIEKIRLNSLGHPCIVKPREKILWFRWQCDEPFAQTQTGKYVPCETPEWAECTLGFI